MNLTTFLSCFQQESTLPVQRVWCFHASHYPLLFFSWLLKSNLITPVQSMNLAMVSCEDLARTLDMAFLGETMTYWLGNSYDLDAAYKDQLHTYLKNYHGPHRVILFGVPKKEQTGNQLLIDISQPVDKDTYHLIMELCKLGNNSAFAHELFAQVTELSLDQVYIMVQYQQVVGQRTTPFFREWFSKIIVPERSLFHLSQHLFSKNKKLFMQHWEHIKGDYADEFWPVFWAEQFWQAYWYVTLMTRDQPQEAKQYVRRLPFSFTQRDWRRYSPDELAKAQAHVYEVDYQLKNGCSLGLLELRLLHFMQ